MFRLLFESTSLFSRDRKRNIPGFNWLVRLGCLSAWLFFTSSLFAQTTLQGQLNTLWGDPGPDSGQPAIKVLTLTEDNGRITELYASDELMSAAGGFFAWNGKRVSVTLRGQDAELPGLDLRPGTRQVAVMKLVGNAGSADAADAVNITGSHPWVSILCKFSDVADEPEDLAFFQGMYANAQGGLDDYWRKVSYGNIDIIGSTAVDWVVLPQVQTFYVPTPGSGGNANLGALFDDCTAAADPFVDFSNGGTGGFSGINMMFNDDLDGFAWGGGQFGNLDGVSKVWRVTWEPPWGYANSGVMSHEMGHGFGLPHANNWDNDGYPYDSPWDVMSAATGSHSVFDPTYGRLGQHINMYHKLQLDWIAPARLVDVNDGEEMTVTIDASAFEGSTNYYAARLEIPGSSRYYMVEVRKRIGGYDANLPGNAVIIHEVVPGRSEPSWAYDAAVPPANFGNNEGTMFKVGETFLDASEEIVINILSETTDGFVIEIDRNGPDPGLDFENGFE